MNVRTVLFFALFTVPFFDRLLVTVSGLHVYFSLRAKKHDAVPPSRYPFARSCQELRTLCNHDIVSNPLRSAVRFVHAAWKVTGIFVRHPTHPQKTWKMSTHASFSVESVIIHPRTA